MFYKGQTYRVNGVLGVSRAIGDVKHKPHITATPETTTIQLNSLDELLILCSDGILESMTKKELYLMAEQMKSEGRSLE